MIVYVGIFVCDQDKETDFLEKKINFLEINSYHHFPPILFMYKKYLVDICSSVSYEFIKETKKGSIQWFNDKKNIIGKELKYIDQNQFSILVDYPKKNPLIITLIMDEEISFHLAQHLIDGIKNFLKDIPIHQIKHINLNQHSDFVNLIKDCELAKITLINEELAETKKVLVRSVEEILERGEKIESILERSEKLSEASLNFYKKARKLNSCCQIL